MLEIKHLSKRYKNSKFYSVKDLSFTLKDGEIFGFLGKNGAGKSTTIKCITGILPFEEGQIKVCGYDVAKNPIEAKLNIGYVPDNHAVYENLTGREYVSYMGNIYKVPKDVIEERIEKFSKLFSMSHAIDNQIRSYSHGMHQKICIIAALIHNPKFWVLDEPLMGLDPQSTFEIRQYMLEHKKLGNTVFFSSHNIDMVEKLCDRVAIMNRGQLMEIIDVKKFMAESEVPLEDYFLNMTRDENAKVINYEDKKTIRRNKKNAKKKLREEKKQKAKQDKKAKKEKAENKKETEQK
jgi:ABC-2 type transport system ATP-binding protein